MAILPKGVQFVKINQLYPYNDYSVCMLHLNRKFKINSFEHTIKVGYKLYDNTFIWNSHAAYTENNEIYPKC